MNSTTSELTQSSLNNFLKIGKTKGGKCRGYTSLIKGIEAGMKM